MTSEIERELLNAERPDPPPGLRQRVLATANPLVQPHDSRLDGIWFSPRWRLAALLVFFGLVAADRLSGVPEDGLTQADGLPGRSAVAVAAQAAVDAGLGKADVAAIAAQVALAQRASDIDTTRSVRRELTGAPQ